jgi:3-deoxy-D-manno-octulosonic-acid transferase
MRSFLGMAIYRLLLPGLFLVAFPAWLIKMARRGGFGSGLRERLSWYRTSLDYEPCAAVHLHAVSVGEALLALKLLREWRKADPDQRFVLATGTATGHAVALENAPDDVRVVYAPLDFKWMVRRYLNRFEPTQIVLVEGEAWPNLLHECNRRAVPVRLVNARVSPRSKRRYQKFATWIRPVFSLLDLVAVQEPEDADIWNELGISRDRIIVTGSLKFDPGSGARPQARAEFSGMLGAFGSDRPIVLAASTHAGEEILIARALREASSEALFAVVPRHAERRTEVRAALEAEGFEVILRSSFSPPSTPSNAVFVIDSTGELRDWTAHADVVVIGKSFLGSGGQNPCEAVIAGKPVVFGPHMENFEPLATRLASSGGCLRVETSENLAKTLRTALAGGPLLKSGIIAARATLARHEGACARTVLLLRA